MYEPRVGQSTFPARRMVPWKSSIVFDTTAAESTRLLNENFSMFVRTFLPRYPQPDTDAIET